MLRWLGRFGVLTKGVRDAWINLVEPLATQPQGIKSEYYALAAAIGEAGADPVQILVAANGTVRQKHAEEFPLGQRWLRSLLWFWLA